MRNKINFIAKDDWPPMSPDLNPMDFSMWDSRSEKVYRERTEPFTEETLREAIRKAWKEISLKEIQKSIKSWKARIRTVINEKGGSTDHVKN